MTDNATTSDTDGPAARLDKLPHDRLTFRDCFADHASVRSTCVHDNGPRAARVSIAIPTFQRPELLIETVRSALAQTVEGGIEIIIVDNDPETDARRWISRYPELRDAPLRYFVNGENIGMFGNWNRCIELARGEWMTILNDDDLIDDTFTARMIETLDHHRNIDGIICRKRFLDQRPDAASHENTGWKKWASVAWCEARFRGRPARRIGFEKLFWGGMLGNSAGFVFRPGDAHRIGGFYPEEFPGADNWFFVRFASLFELWQHRDIAASVRIANNESAKRSTLEGFMRDFRRMQMVIAQDRVPRWWMRFSPLMSARHREEIRQFWGEEFSRAEVEDLLGIRLPKDRPYLLWSIRAALGGF